MVDCWTLASENQSSTQNLYHSLRKLLKSGKDKEEREHIRRMLALLRNTWISSSENSVPSSGTLINSIDLQKRAHESTATTPQL